MKKIIGMLVGSFLILAWFAASPAESAKFRIGAHFALFGSTDVVAHRLGYFKEAGLDYDFKIFKSGKSMRNGVIQGNLDVAATGFAPFVAAISKDTNVKGLAVSARICGLAYIAVRSDSKIKSVQDLKGKSFATSGGGTQHYTVLMHVLPQSGLKTSDLKYVRTKASNRLSQIVAGVVDSGLVADPQAEIAVRQGKIRLLTSFCKYDNTRMVVLGNPKTLKSNSDGFVKYFRGWLRAQDLLKKNPEKFTKVYLRHLQEAGTKVDFDVLLSVVKRIKLAPPITAEVRAYLNQMGANQKKLGWIKRVPSFTGKHSKMLDDSTYQKAAASMNN